MKYTFCNFGSYFDFNPTENIFPYPNEGPVRNIDFYADKVLTANNKAVYLITDTGIIVEA